MSIDYLTIGSVPWDEPCVQVSQTEPYGDEMRAECKRFIECIRQHCGEEPEGAHLMVKSFPHDFGTYYEVVCKYYDNDEAGVDYAFHVESNAPSQWDGSGATRWHDPSDRDVGVCTNKAISSVLDVKDANGVSGLSLELGMAWSWIKDHGKDDVPEDSLMRHMVCMCSQTLEEVYGVRVYDDGILRRNVALNKIKDDDSNDFFPIQIQGAI